MVNNLYLEKIASTLLKRIGVGAISGGVIGVAVSPKGERVHGAMLGGVAGGITGGVYHAFNPASTLISKGKASLTDSEKSIIQARRDAQMNRQSSRQPSSPSPLEGLPSKDSQNAQSAAASTRRAKIAKAKANMTPEQLADHEARLAHRMSTGTSKYPTNKP